MTTTPTHWPPGSGDRLWIDALDHLPMYLREIDGTNHPGPRPQRQQASSRCIHKLVAPSPLPIRSPFSEISVSLIKERHHHQPAGPRYNTTLAHPHPTNTLKPTPTGNSRRSRLTLDQAHHRTRIHKHNGSSHVTLRSPTKHPLRIRTTTLAAVGRHQVLASFHLEPPRPRRPGLAHVRDAPPDSPA